MKHNDNNVIVAEVESILILEKTSKKGNKYKCIVAIDENDNEHFINFVN